MKLPSGKFAIIMTSVIAMIAVSIAVLLGILVLGDRSPDPQLSQITQDEYSVPVKVKIVSISGRNAAYIVPEEVRWDSRHSKLLYNLSNPKETTLAFIETLANNDAEALGFLLGKSAKDYWAGKGYTPSQVLDTYESMYMNMKEPYIFGLEQGEDEPSEGMLSVKLIRDSGEISFELNAQPDGTWKI